jgi:hypothetical protein
MKLSLPIVLIESPGWGESKIQFSDRKLLLLFRTDLQIIQALGKLFKWKKPCSCPQCGGSRLWGHGFVPRYFVGFNQGLWMKRWRCPDCGAVHTARPASFLPRMQYSIRSQKSCLTVKLGWKPFLSEIPRQTQQYWWRNFLSRAKESENWKAPFSFYFQKSHRHQLPVSKRRIYRESYPLAVAPYLPFALTVKSRPFSLE